MIGFLTGCCLFTLLVVTGQILGAFTVADLPAIEAISASFGLAVGGFVAFMALGPWV